MTKEKNTLDTCIRIFNEYLEGKGLRRTAERFMILEKAAGLGKAFNIDMLGTAMDEANCHVAKATIYRTVRSLCECGILSARPGRGREQYYEFSGRPRMMSVCRACGRVREIKNASLSSFLASLRIRGFRPEVYSLTVDGLCTSCARKVAPAPSFSNSIPKTSNISIK